MSVPVSQPRVRALVFDLDGTLIDSLPGIASSLEVAFRAVGKPLPPRDLRGVIGPPIRQIALALDPALAADEVEAVARAFRAHYDSQGWRATVLFEHVAEVLQRCREKGLRLFIVTNKPSLATQQILRQFALQECFELVFSKDSRDPQFASKAEMLGALLQQAEVDSSAALMVGDTHEDQQAAEHNGLAFVHAAYGYGAAPGAAGVLRNFQQLEDLLAQGEAK